MNNNIKKHDLTIGKMNNNCFVMQIEDKSECAIIDCPGDGRNIIAELERLELKPVILLLTHGHFDHITGVDRIRETYPDIIVVIGEDDAEMMTSSAENLSAMAGETPFETSEADFMIADGDILNYAGLNIECIHTPGHSKGSICYIIGDYLFTGDVLFKRSIGRTDLPGGSYNVLIQSLKRLADLTKNFDVFPGHEAYTSLEYERKHNSYLQF